MCFYKDTQAILAKNSLRQFFISKVAQNQKTEKIAEAKSKIFQVKEEENSENLPHKKLHISDDLFKDLVKLSTGDTCEGNFTDTSASDGNPSPIHQIMMDSKAKLQTVGLKEEFISQETSSKEIQFHPEKFDDLLTMIERNNKMLEEFQVSQSLIQQKIEDISKQTKNEEYEESPFERLNRMSRREKEAVRATTSPTPLELLLIFTNGRNSFPYAIRLSMGLPSPILRERNIKISVELVKTSDGTVIENHGSMLLQISLHTWELPSNPILRNRAGNKVLQGEDECELKNGQGSFDKLQINEVTSKFINGYIGILVVAKRPINFGTSLESLHQKRLIKIQDIRPLLVEKVIVKSKKKNQIPKP